MTNRCSVCNINITKRNEKKHAKMHKHQEMLARLREIELDCKRESTSSKRIRIASKSSVQQFEPQRGQDIDQVGHLENYLGDVYDENYLDDSLEEMSKRISIFGLNGQMNPVANTSDIEADEIVDNDVQVEERDELLLLLNDLKKFKITIENLLSVESRAGELLESLDKTARSSIELKNLLQANNASKKLTEMTFSWFNKFLKENVGEEGNVMTVDQLLSPYKCNKIINDCLHKDNTASYDMYVKECKLYYPSDKSLVCPYCKEPRYKSDTLFDGYNQAVQKNHQLPLRWQLAEFLSYDPNVTKISNYKKLVADSHLQAPEHLYKDVFDGQAHYGPKENTELTLASSHRWIQSL
ncbi:hypothetical protein INT48_001695 [Thamnidium elegans]|uniref:Uncharacterized protein n=1 Tax=Thamnidium elegans TaxID=101142 RepID=A0A8H7SQG1_9FUNG|nr:hypothetical protein INT48_001695 [Thamnidium elegans]